MWILFNPQIWMQNFFCNKFNLLEWIHKKPGILNSGQCEFWDTLLYEFYNKFKCEFWMIWILEKMNADGKWLFKRDEWWPWRLLNQKQIIWHNQIIPPRVSHSKLNQNNFWHCWTKVSINILICKYIAVYFYIFF